VTPEQQFGANVRRLRREARLTQMALGERAGMHFTEISRIERHERTVRLDTIVKVARALGVPAAELLDGIR
jgi:transcriptional regulator with XRE-family HTH domain